MSISYPFTPINSVFKKNMLQSKVTLREYKVWDGVSYLAYSFPETRETLTITTTCRQIGELIRLPFQHVATALQKLARRGLITILKKGFWGKDGEKEPSIIQLNPVTNLVTQENSNNKPINKSVTHQVTKSVTPPSNQNSDTTKRNIEKKHDMHDNVSFINSDSNFSTKEKTKQPVTTMTTIIDKKSVPINSIEDESKQQEKTNYKFTMGGEWFNNTVNNTTYKKQPEGGKLSSIGSIIASIPTPQVKEQPQPVNIIENPPAPMSPVSALAPALSDSNDLISAGVQEKAIYIGMNELKKRNIPDIPGTIHALGTLLKGKKNILNPSGYFVKLCKEVSLETLFKPVPASTCEHSVSVVPSVEKTRRAAEEFWKEEKTAISAEEVLTTLSKTCPEKLYAIIQDVNNDRKIQRGLSFMPEAGEAKKIALENIILTEFKKAYPEIVI